MTGMVDMKPEEVFEQYRTLLFSVAYRVLGRAADAEDAVQDAWLRWSAADHTQVLDPKAYLVRIVTNLAVDRLRSAQRRRETYIGPWLPEPILTGPDVAEDAERADSVSLAMLVVLETLSPLERAVFVLREVFGFSYREVAEAIDRSEASVRQLGHRAREHVEARRPRFETGRDERRAVTETFLAATLGGDLNRLMELLAPDVTLWADGGGKVRAPRRPIRGARKVATWLAAVVGRPYEGVDPRDMSVETVDVNGGPAVVLHGGGRVLSVITVDVDDHGRIATIHTVANPDKLAATAAGRAHPLA